VLSSSTAASPIDVPRGEDIGLSGENPGLHGEPPGLRDDVFGSRDGHPTLRGVQRRELGEADGVVPDGTTVFADEIAGVANLDPDLLDALRGAATDAAHDGVELFVESGWRSRAYQTQLLREAISKYGSKKEAARWVATADTSPHEAGDAVDIGPPDATAWLSEHGDEYGLCQIFRNEPWHYELRARAIDRGCPRMYADPTHDPRMRQ
jgi:D-alanyl-D-alanine carboxypeptidase